jgi:hypothetical protein
VALPVETQPSRTSPGPPTALVKQNIYPCFQLVTGISCHSMP